MAKINVILYARVSTDDQAKHGYSLEYQVEVLRKFCTFKGYDIKAIIKEDFSAKTFERPEWKKIVAMTKANKGQINKVLFLRWDRFSRNTEDAYTVIRKLKAQGIEANAIDQIIDFSVPENKLMLAFYLALPEVENDKISNRTKEGLYQSKLNGCWVSTAPFGYDHIRISQKHSSLTPNKDSHLVKELFQLMATGGYSIADLQKKLKTQGFSKCKQATINILRNIVYLGMIQIAQYKGESAKIIKGLHEPIIDEETFEKVQDVLLGKRRRHKRRDTSALYPLKLILKCSKCELSLTASASKNRVKVLYHYYHCVKNHGHDRFRVEKVHQAFDAVLQSINTPPEIIKLYHAIVLNEYNAQNKGLNKDLQEIEKQIDLAKKKIFNIEDKLGEGLLDSVSYHRMMIRFQDEENDLIMKHATLKTETLPMKRELDYAITLFENLGRIYKSGSHELRSIMLGSIFPYPIYFEDGGFRTKEVNSLFELFVVKTNELKGLKIETSRLGGDSSSEAPAAGLEPATL